MTNRLRPVGSYLVSTGYDQAAFQSTLKGYTVPSRLTAIIDGRSSRSGGVSIPVVNPATEGQISELIEDDAASVDAAAQSARGAFEEGPWPRLALAERKRILRNVRDVILANAEELAYLDCIDTGVPLWDIRGRKLNRVAENFEFFCELASTVSGRTYQQNDRFITLVTHEPRGVAAILAPWNSPLSLASMQIAPCIAFGNTCVVKPSEHTPLSLFRFVELLQQAGLPPGVVNLVNGRGPRTGAELVAHKKIDMVKFIGGTETGRLILSSAGRTLKKVGLELGGKSANIICADADPQDALDGALASIYSNNGQQCLAGSRILVQRDIARDFIRRFVERAGNIRVGDPLDPRTEVGPVAFKQHYERVLSYVEIAREGGAELLVGGARAPGFERGYYVSPTAVLAPNNSLRVCQEEIFGPFATFIVFDTVDEAIAIANDSSFGLVAYVWTGSVRNAMQTSQRIKAGTVWINTPLVRELRAPFGGYKESGIGRDGSDGSLDFFTESKTTTIPIDRADVRRFGLEKHPPG